MKDNVRANFLASSMLITFLVAKLKEKLDSYKFGLPTLTLQTECKQYEAIKEEIEAVNTLLADSRKLQLFFVLVGT